MSRLVPPVLRSVPRVWLLLLPFVGIGLLALSQHAFWRDEVNPWLIARDSGTWLEFWQNIRYEGHPLLWYLCLAALQRITDSLVAMQLLHLALGTGAVVLFFCYSPFRLREKFLFAFGYYPFYEYLVLSRNYVFGLLGTFLFCTLFPYRTSGYLPLALTLGIMANSHAYALVIAAFLGLILGLEFLCDRHHRQTYWQRSNLLDLVLSLVIFGVLIGLATYMILPPADSQLHGGTTFMWTFDWHRLLVAIGKLPGAYLLIPPNSKRWLDLIVMDLLGLGIFCSIALSLIRKPFALLFYGVATAATTFIFFYAKDVGSFRHFGSLYLILWASLWLAHHYSPWDRLRALLQIPDPLVARVQSWIPRICVLILSLHCGTGLVTMGRELGVPWSASRATAQYMQEQQLDRAVIVASRDANMAALAGYLHRQFYYPETGKMGSFTLFLADRQEATPDVILAHTREILTGQRSLTPTPPAQVLLLLNQALDPQALSPQTLDPQAFHPTRPPIAQLVSSEAPPSWWGVRGLSLAPIAQFERSYLHDEKYFLYWAALSPDEGET